MRTTSRVWSLVLLGLLIVGCSASPQSSTGSQRTEAPSAAPKRMVAAIRGNPASVSNVLNAGGGGRIDGGVEMSGLMSSGFAVQSERGQWVPVLAEQLPSLDNGLWTLLPDGRMETSWTIKKGALWHDGAPFTAQDVVFSTTMLRDTTMPWIVEPVYRYIEAVQAVDDRTVKVVWNQPYIRADQLPMNPVFPAHLLEEKYQTDKENVATLPFWTSEFVGTGPFRVKDFVRDSHVELAAFDGYVLGRPKLDELEVRFIADDNALAANILAGAVDMTLGPGMSVEQGIQVRDRWADGTMVTAKEFALSMNSQLLNPDPPIVGNPQFRKALLMAADRKRLADELMYGLSDVADSSISPMEAEYPYVEPGFVRYSFEPARSAQMIEELGFRKGPDGMFQDSAGKPLSVQIMATQDDTNAKPQFAILDMWRSIGITPDAEIVTAQRQRDLAYRANFRSFSLQAGISSGADGVSALLTREMRTAERNYLGRNYTRHSNPEIDALVDRYFTTIPFDERMDVLRQIIHYTTDNLVWVPLYWRVLPTLMHNRLVDVTPYGNGDQFRNAEQWSVRS